MKKTKTPTPATETTTRKPTTTRKTTHMALPTNPPPPTTRTMEATTTKTTTNTKKECDWSLDVIRNATCYIHKPVRIITNKELSDVRVICTIGPNCIDLQRKSKLLF